MTGPEHYKAAEQLLRDIEATPEESVGSVAVVVAQAQVHATLALAAAQAILPQLAADSGLRDFEAWYAAAGAGSYGSDI